MLVKNKRMIVIIIIALILVVVAVISYYFWQKRKAEIKNEEPLKKLSEEQLMGVKYLPQEQKIRYLSLETGTFKELDLNNNETKELTQKPLDLVQEIFWSPNGKKAILKVKNNRVILEQRGYLVDRQAQDNEITNWLFDIEGEELIELPKKINGLAWLDNQDIVYCYSEISGYEETSPIKNDVLAKSNYRGDDYQIITNLDIPICYNSMLSYSKQKDKIIISPEVEGVGDNYIYVYDLKQKQFNKISEGQLTAFGNFSPQGNYIFLYQITDNTEKFDLYLANQFGVDKKNLQLSTKYSLAITDELEKNIFVATMAEEKNTVLEINIGSLDKKIIIDKIDNSNLTDISQIGLLDRGLFFVEKNYLYSINL